MSTNEEISEEHVQLATASMHTNPESNPLLANQPRKWLFFCRSVSPHKKTKYLNKSLSAKYSRQPLFYAVRVCLQ